MTRAASSSSCAASSERSRQITASSPCWHRTYAGKTTLGTPLDGEYYTNEVCGELATRPYGMGPRLHRQLAALPGWSRRCAGRMKNGRDGYSDPALGR
jgi:hypothetical protein